jgi:hypothetical protein
LKNDPKTLEKSIKIIKNDLAGTANLSDFEKSQND